jgi:hypothetical protein
LFVAAEKLARTKGESVLKDGVCRAQLVPCFALQVLHAAAMHHQEHEAGQQDEQHDHRDEDLRREAEFDFRNFSDGRRHFSIWEDL